MNEKQLEFSLKSLEADAAMEALERRERGDKPSPESPLTDQDVAAIKALAVDLDEEFYERKAAQLLGALREPDVRELGSLEDARAARAARNAGVERDAGAARASRLRRFKQSLFVGGPLMAAAAGVLLWLMPVGELGPVLEVAEVTDSKLRGTAPSSAAAPSVVPVSVDGCLNVRIPLQKSAAQLSEDVSTQAYLVSGERTVSWNLSLQPDPQGALSTTAGCQALPSEVRGGRWDVVMLVGYAGRLRWHGQAALHAAMSGSDHGEYKGIQYVRRSLELAANPAELAK